ncbi:preprotein translocase subunit SecF [Hamadaea flava]|uniref:Protein-export membrane protein SecF n=1 Tax=Hamadaea flava TaxID=1742688 RepID=A0ABV8LQD3_9ACTN|nr:protein translocase subunit SecF [Hamadaea flava]MCP2322419.1 preprotein translocase subunit SecF [Hamadaea flava]
MSKSGLATRLYRGEAGLNIIGKRKVWFGVVGVVLLIALGSFFARGFTAGIEFKGGTEFTVPASAGTIEQVQDAVGAQIVKVDSEAAVGTSQHLGGSQPSYKIRTTPISSDQANQVKAAVAQQLGISSDVISYDVVSGAWGKQVTEKALFSLAIFLALVTVFLIIRFEWRMAVAALASLAFDLLAAAAVYSLVGFEISPSTVIGFLTILGFALYDVVVVFDKVQENTRSITGSSTQTYAEAANLAVNQTLMRSINTGLVALLPVGGLLFIGAGLLGAGTLKDLGLVLFIGMGTAVYSSIFFATPVLVTLKEFEPKIATHTQRVLARRASGAGKAAAGTPTQAAPEPELATTGGGTAAPRPGARPAGRKPAGGKSGSGGGKAVRPGAPKRR